MKLLIADPQPKVRHALIIWISGQPDLEFVGEADNAMDLLTKLDQFKPEVVILDCSLPGMPPSELTASIRRASKDVVIILLTSNPLDRCQTDGLDVDYVVSKVDPPNRMLDVILKSGHQQGQKSR